MRYILKNKDKNVLEFEVENMEEYTQFMGQITSSKIVNLHIIDELLLPKSIKKENVKTNLSSWIQARKVPKNREFVDEIIASYKKEDEKEQLMDYVNVSLALSLNDSFWIVPADKDYKWKDYNLYNNSFDESLKLVAFGVHLSKMKHLTSSPEYTTNGMLRKCWHKDNGQIYLYKANSKEYANSGKEAYSEYYMAQIASLMNFEHIPYDLKEFHNKLVSSCAIFTNEDEGYLPIYYCLDEELLIQKDTKSLVAMAKIYGEDKLQDLLVFDALIMNTDRHLGNFGMIVDNNTGELLRPAPIFDNGCSLVNILIKDELSDISKALKSKMSYFGYSFDEQLKLFIQPRHTQGLEKLKNFTFKRHEKYNLSEEWLKPIENFIQQRAIKALEIIKEKQNVLKSTSNLRKR
ncbi:transcriptional regulator [Campylobacter upsaliensis]|uniref:Transcriptional regulator n=1 Tax=Campylobacter upsaliensis TaxID=28080 RepID=A0A7U8B4M1_CAMUP|nr:transcriptional regulator [Campylobacter upsaliensis]EAH9147216.1 transcriptional regulator [Campylobacter upsaliensis]EAI0017199.1 transcriptional regulator [Campylobacter upsaliensis]EAJ1622748.1 transcriptional regulator [Campylobacter upsaliensis]EAJ3972055.1 transcriptional regulator [Campylobacter upsaliensis]